MMKSLYSGVAGLKTHNQRMDVIGNNISNVNTTAFKASTVTFKDIFYQSKSRASAGDAISGGTNANQVGYGAHLGSIAQLMTQSGLTYSDRVTDCAIQGEGFFQVMDDAGNIFYTRAGVFHIDNFGNLCDPSGNIVLGVSGDPTGVAASRQRINLYVPPVDNNAASVTKTLNLNNESYTFTVSASTYGEDGNMNVTFVNSDVPFATQNGSAIVVYLDFAQEFGVDPANGNWLGNEQAVMDFEDAVYAAIQAGGVTLPDGVLPLRFNFESLPPDDGVDPEVRAAQASNTLVYEASYTPEATTQNPTPAEITADLDLTFTANVAGDFANSFEIDIRVNSKATDISARWNENVLTITIPDGDVSLSDLQDAIDAAASGNPNKALTVSTANGDATSNPAGIAISADSAAVIAGKGVTLRLGLANGRDNFFKTLMESVGSLTLADGRLAADQTTEDLEEIFIDDNGVIYGVHAVHGTIAMGRIDLVIFENPEGLNQYGTSYWKQSLSSGEPEVVTANDYGVGSVVSQALEMSNTDLAQEISDMIITQRGYQANTRVITVTDQMLEELVNLKR